MSEASSPEISTELLRRWYEKMLLIREFEDRVHEAFQKGLVFGSTHLCQGQVAMTFFGDGATNHRVIDGAEGAKFLRLFKRILEDPTSMYP